MARVGDKCSRCGLDWERCQEDKWVSELVDRGPSEDKLRDTSRVGLGETEAELVIGAYFALRERYGSGEYDWDDVWSEAIEAAAELGL